MPIVYNSSTALMLIKQSAQEFGSPLEEHLADIRDHVTRERWESEGDDLIDLVSMIQGLNELHGRKNHHWFTTSMAERAGFKAVLAQL